MTPGARGVTAEERFSRAVLIALAEHEGDAARAIFMGDYGALRASRVACADAISAAACALAEAVMERAAEANESPTTTEEETCA